MFRSFLSAPEILLQSKMRLNRTMLLYRHEPNSTFVSKSICHDCYQLSSFAYQDEDIFIARPISSEAIIRFCCNTSVF